MTAPYRWCPESVKEKKNCNAVWKLNAHHAWLRSSHLSRLVFTCIMMMSATAMATHTHTGQPTHIWQWTRDFFSFTPHFFFFLLCEEENICPAAFDQGSRNFWNFHPWFASTIESALTPFFRFLFQNYTSLLIQGERKSLILFFFITIGISIWKCFR